MKLSDVTKKLKNLSKLNLNTLRFNLHYFPLKQALKFPVLLSNSKLLSLKGQVIINYEDIKFGMIQLGQKRVSLFENNSKGIIWENNGICIFRGRVFIGSGSAISIGKQGCIDFGDNFIATTSVKMASYKRITFGANCRVAWETILIDTDFHETINRTTGERSEMTKEIIFGNNNWVGIRCLILKGTKTPDYCIVGANSLTNKEYDIPSYSLIAGSPAKLRLENVFRDLESNVMN